jgi:hypothetical protein
MRDVTTLFEQQLARRNCCSMMSSLFRFMGMMERDPKFVFDLLSATHDDMDSESGSKGSYHLAWEYNMLHLSENEAAAVGGEEDNAYPILHTPREQVEYE